MAVWQILERQQPDLTFDIVLLNAQGELNATLAADVPEGRLTLGPSLGAEFLAAGVTDGFSWAGNVLYLDPQVVPEGTTRDTVVGVLIAHDPATPAPVDPYITKLIAFEIEAQAIIDTNGNVTTAAKAFMADFLLWAANDVPR